MFKEGDKVKDIDNFFECVGTVIAIDFTKPFPYGVIFESSGKLPVWMSEENLKKV